MSAVDQLHDYTRTVDPTGLLAADPATALQKWAGDTALHDLLDHLRTLDVHDPATADDLADRAALDALPAIRRLRGALPTPAVAVVRLVAEAVAALGLPDATAWTQLADHVEEADDARTPLLDLLRAADGERDWDADLAEMVRTDPHAAHPTSPYRWSDGTVRSSADDQVVEATMTATTVTSIRVVEDVLDPTSRVLADVYRPLGRCVAVVDTNVADAHGDRLRAYFDHHGVQLDVLVLRAMEVDKGIDTVERLLGHYKQVGVSRAEPVLVVGGGVLTDVAGLACALYHRNTPYVMLSTSLVAGIDAGPSPRTCADGFGYKNLFGAYHPPVLSITDRTFLATMREGWLRHGVAEIIKMATVKDAELFAELEAAGEPLVTSRFGTTGPDAAAMAAPSRRILGAAMRSYVEAEYGNLYETHQARPHAYGHTWSPGFEIAAGLLHGHAVAIGMAFGAVLAGRVGWLPETGVQRVLRLLDTYSLSIWDDTLDDDDLLWEAQQRIVQKRGGALVAPLPRGDIGEVGYLPRLSRPDLRAAVAELHERAAAMPRGGLGIDRRCADVGLEDPATVGAERPPLAASA